MNVDEAWATLTSVNSTPVQRRDTALDILIFLARVPIMLAEESGQSLETGAEVATRIAACEAVIRAEFAFADR